MNIDEKYILDNSSPQDDLMAELERTTYQRTVHPHMISGHLQGKFLELLTRMIKPGKVLEIGTFTGYSALSIAAGLEEGASIDTIEADEELQDISAGFFARSPQGTKITQHIGSAFEIAPGLGKIFDMVFIDGGKREYPEYYNMLMGEGGFSHYGALVRSGSYILADNILWYGKVARPAHTDADTLALARFNRMVAEDRRLENIILPLRDGINVIRVI